MSKLDSEPISARLVIEIIAVFGVLGLIVWLLTCIPWF